MTSVNHMILLGRLGADPEARESAGGLMVRLRVATSRRFKDKNGERQEKTTWHSVMVFGKTAEIAKTYLRKGSEVFVTGRLETRKYTGKDGVERWATDVIAEDLTLGARPKDEEAQAPAPAPAPAQKPAGSYDDIPF